MYLINQYQHCFNMPDFPLDWMAHKYIHTTKKSVDWLLSASVKGGRHLKPPKFEHIPPFFCANTFDTSLLFIVCALK